MSPFVTGTHKGQDLHAFEVTISYSHAAAERLGMAILKHGLQVTQAWAPNGFVRGYAVHLIVTVPEANVRAAQTTMGDADWRTPARVAAGSNSPSPTWGELRDQVQALLSTHKGPHLPCGHPVTLLVFDSVDGARYTCPLCKQQAREDA
jgi:hypothetical protein